MKWERGDEKSFSFRSLKLSPPNVDPFSSQSFQHEKEKKTHLQLVDAPDAIAFAKDYSLMTFGLLLPAVNDGSFSVFSVYPKPHSVSELFRFSMLFCLFNPKKIEHHYNANIQHISTSPSWYDSKFFYDVTVYQKNRTLLKHSLARSRAFSKMFCRKLGSAMEIVIITEPIHNHCTGNVKEQK